MRKLPSSESGVFNPRLLFAFLLATAACLLAIASFAAPNPMMGTLSTSTRALTYTDSVGAPPNLTGFAGALNCGPNDSLCSVYNLTIDPSISAAASAAQQQIRIVWSWNPPAVDNDVFVLDATGAIVAKNQSTADPSAIILPATFPAGVYKLVLVLSTGAPVPYTTTINLEQAPISPPPCPPGDANCAPPRFQSYPAGPGQADNAGEPSLGVDWNPNDPTAKDTTSPSFTTGIQLKNTGGVALFTSGSNEFRVNFDDCPSPAVYNWQDVSALSDQTFVLSDPIGFVDHYTNLELGRQYPPLRTPGRGFSIDLIGGQGNSLGAFSDDDFATSLPGGTGGPGAGPDHQTIGGGPYSGTPPANASYPATPLPGQTRNAIYYCSQNIVAESQCSRSDDGGQTFGPAIPIFNPTVCPGGITGHVKVAPDGTVYVANSSCGTTSGTAGVAVSTDNGVTWKENNVPGSTSSLDPYVAIGQNSIGKAGGQATNTIYLAYVDGNGHAKAAFSHDRGISWSIPADVGAPYGITHAVFAIAAAGDDNRAAVSFVGTGDGISAPGAVGTCDPYGTGQDANKHDSCANIWHLYIATTYNGGQSWITTDATPNDPIQQGAICLQGTTCAAGRNLLDFNDMAIDAEGRILAGYADGCVNCSNTFGGQSGASHGTVTRQSGGRRLFAFFDPNPAEPKVPAAPQLVSAVSRPTGGALITWLEPDNGGSPITGYDIYRGATSGGEGATPIGHVDGNTTTKFVDTTAMPGANAFYYVRAINASGVGPHCGELPLIAGGPGEDICVAPGLTELLDPAGDSTGAPNTGTDLHSFQLAQPYQTDGIPRLIFTINTDPAPSQTHQGGFAIYVSMKNPDGKVHGVHMAYYASGPGAASPVFESYIASTNTNGGSDGRFVVAGSQIPAPGSSYDNVNGKITIIVKASDLNLMPGAVINGFNSASTQSTDPAQPGLPGATATLDQMPDSLGYIGSYTVHDSQFCNTAPVAVLTATPLTGPAPLAVQFSSANSSDPDPGDSVASSTFFFGDGTSVTCPGGAGCTGATGASHTYQTAGNYDASLVVTDSRGKNSTNTARLAIAVTTPGPPLMGVVSRKTHAGVGDFDVILPLGNSPATEPRTGGAQGNHIVIFGFVNALSSVGSVNATAQTQGGNQPVTITSNGIGADSHQYIVNLTGVPNASIVTVTLNNVTDSAAKTGSVSVKMGALLGDSNGDGTVNSGDALQARNRSGQLVDSVNFRSDSNLDGTVNSGDAIVVRNNSGKTVVGLSAEPIAPRQSNR